MKLEYIDFEILTRIERHPDIKYSQRQLMQEIQGSLGAINKSIQNLLKVGYLLKSKQRNYEISESGLNSLAPFRVKRAIFMAAGFGSRLVPITLNTPKPLILVHGKRIIETLLDAIEAAQIKEVLIVRGYLGEQFDILLKKYPNITFIENPVYNETNNISSIHLVKDQLANAYVLESDLVLYHPDLIRKYEFESNYLGLRVDRSDDWCFETKKDWITKVKVGGKNVFHMFGISYWTQDDAKKLSSDIAHVFEAPGGKEKYWDEVPLKDCQTNYQVKVRKVLPNQIIEIDTFNELKQIDPIYDVH